MSSYRIIDANQKERGPFDAERICQRLAEGRSDAQTRVQIEGRTEWVQLGDIAEFAEFLKRKTASSSGATATKTTVKPDQQPAPLTRKQCPVCRSRDTGDERTGWKGVFDTQAFRSRICYQCGTVWRPGCSRRIAILMITAGLGLPVLMVPIYLTMNRYFHELNHELRTDFPAGIPTPPPAPGNHWFIFTGSWLVGLRAAIYGVNVLRGRSGRLEILKKAEGSLP